MDSVIREKARERMQGFCRACPKCDGRACAGEVPGMGGLGTGASFQANIEALRDVRFAMRCLHDAAEPRTGVTLLGLELALPVLAAPIGGVSFNMGVTEVSEARYIEAVINGCKAAGIVGCGGDGAADNIPEASFRAIQGAGGWGIPFVKPWAAKELELRLGAAAATGCKVIGMDVDAAGLITLRKQGKPVSPKTSAELAAIAARVHRDGALFLIKGVMTVEDARIALEAGVDGLVVSNHGGRVLDHTPGTAEVLPAIAAYVAGRIPVLVDGGVRDGSDVLKMLALGAGAVLIGRPFSLAAIGALEAGVLDYVNELRSGLLSAMTLTGCSSPEAAGPHLLHRPVKAPA